MTSIGEVIARIASEDEAANESWNTFIKDVIGLLRDVEHEGLPIGKNEPGGRFLNVSCRRLNAAEQCDVAQGTIVKPKDIADALVLMRNADSPIDQAQFRSELLIISELFREDGGSGTP